MRIVAYALLMMLGSGGLAAHESAPVATPEAAPVLAATPPMGWSTWNHYAHAISDKLIREQADAMVASGMKDAGYVYVHIDGGWEGQRDANGMLHPLPTFPDMKALGDYIHSKGLKFGLYSGPGPVTCAGAEASYGHEEQDAQMFASWGVDYLKYDLCSYRIIMQQESGGDVTKSEAMMRAAYEKMHQAILKTGRPMVFSMCHVIWIGRSTRCSPTAFPRGWARIIQVGPAGPRAAGPGEQAGDRLLRAAWMTRRPRASIPGSSRTWSRCSTPSR